MHSSKPNPRILEKVRAVNHPEPKGYVYINHMFALTPESVKLTNSTIQGKNTIIMGDDLQARKC